MAIISACPSCGGRIRVADAYSGRKVKCPRCAGVFVAAGAPDDDPPTTRQPDSEESGQDPSEALPFWVWGVCALVPLALLIVALWFLFHSVIVVFIILFLLTLTTASIPAFCFVQYSLARSRAIRDHVGEVSLFGGLAKLVLWEANEGLVFLKNKRISRLIYGPRDGGGTSVILPIFGDELKVRVPLTLKLTQFEDAKVVTRESTQLFLRVAIWWRVANLEKYYYSVDKEVHVVHDSMQIEVIGEPQGKGQRAQQNAAEAWILTLAESCIRKLVSQTTTALIISKTATTYLHVDEKHRKAAGRGLSIQAAPPRPGVNDAPLPDAATPGLLADEIRSMLTPKAAEYGLEIERVEIQEVRLPEAIQQALDDVFKSTLLPAKTEQEALAEQIRLKSLADVLGIESVKLQEVLKQFRGSQYIGGFPKVIDAIFAKAANPAAPPAAIGRRDAADPARSLPKANSAPEVSLMCPSCGGDDITQAGQKVECRACGFTFRLDRKKA